MTDEVSSDVGMTQSQHVEAPAEKLIPQSRVEEIVRERVNQKENRLRNEFEAKLNEVKSSTQNVSASSALTPEDIDKRIVEHQQKMSEELLQYNQQQQQKAAIESFIDKIKDGTKKYEDFESKVASLQLDRIPELAFLANEVENTQDVIYELANNPAKVINILSSVSSDKTIHLAKQAIKQISESIKQNELAKQQHSRKSNEPLGSSMKKSFAGTDNGVRTVSDLRRLRFLKA
ncbi:MAG: hypothetical protein ACYC6W_11085 [Nitrosotalea sp.]